MQFIVLCSSRGTVFQATLDAIKKGELRAECAGLICDRVDRECVEKARKANIQVKIVARKKGEDHESYDRKLQEAILELVPSPPPSPKGRGGQGESLLLACMGWMYLLSPWFLKQWKDRVINVHPSLFPKYPGIQPHDEVLKAKEKESGMTIHVIDEGMDTGKILVQKRCPVLPGDTYETLKERVQKLECEWYPWVLHMIEQGELKL